MKRILQKIASFFGFDNTKVTNKKRNMPRPPVSMESTLGAGMVGGSVKPVANAVDLGPKYKNSATKKRMVRTSKETREEILFAQRAYVRFITWIPEVLRYEGFRRIYKKGYQVSVPAGLGIKFGPGSWSYAGYEHPEGGPAQCTVNRKMRRLALKSLGYLR